MTENKRFTMDNPNDWDFSITDNVTGKVYNCASNILMKELCVVVNTIVEENKQLKSQREDFKRALVEKDKEIMKLRRENNQMKRIIND